MPAATHRRVTVGFHGGQVLALRLTDKQLADLEKGLGEERWYAVDTEEGPVRLNLSEVVYVSADSKEPHVGFG
jgi:hypothetical protein